MLSAFALICAMASAHAQNLSPDDLARHAIERRAIEAVIWGMPAVNLDLMLQAMIGSAKGKPNQIVDWSRLPDWKNQTLTPNPDVIYLMPFFNTKDAGPMVLEIPPADDGVINGTVMDAWQVPLEDVGPAGVDRGKGGKYLILPPGNAAAVPDGYIALASPNYQGYALLRSILRSGSDADVAKAVAYAKRIKVYPLTLAASPPPTTFVDAIDVVYDSTIPYDLRYFQSLDRVVQMEPWLARDKMMIDMLKSIGIEKGKPFNPDAQTQEILKLGRARGPRIAGNQVRGHVQALFRYQPLGAARDARLSQGVIKRLLRSQRISRRQSRPCLYLCLLHPQASGARPVLSDDPQGQGGPESGWQQELSPCRAGERAGEPVLVGDGLRPRDSRPYSRHDPVRPRIAKPRLAKERGWLGGHLFRTESAGR
jgi:hypothetical protein